jgi:GABA(A) receptor-associated protein
MEEFRKRPFEERIEESKRLAYKYYDRVPIVIKPGNSNTPSTNKFKYLIPKTTTVGEFVNVVRRMVNIKSHQALFVFTDGVLPPTSSTMYQVYKDHCEEDGFLYVTYSLENTFGSSSS